MKNTFKITYKDMIKEVERELATRERVYPRWQHEGRMSFETGWRRIEMMKKLLKMLKKSERQEPQQINLFENFQQIK